MGFVFLLSFPVLRFLMQLFFFREFSKLKKYLLLFTPYSYQVALDLTILLLVQSIHTNGHSPFEEFPNHLNFFELGSLSHAV